MDFYSEITKMKEIIRRGWTLRGVPGRTESDAEHTYSCLMIAIYLMSHLKLDLDQLKVLKMITFHDLCEIDSGDVTIVDGVPQEEKYKKEIACIKRLAKDLDMPEIESLWVEFEENKTKEAQFVKRIDKFDAVCQAKIYSDRFDMQALYEEFYGNAKEYTDEMKKFMKKAQKTKK